MFQSGSEAFFFFLTFSFKVPVMGRWGKYLVWFAGVGRLGQSRAGLQEAVMLLSSLDTAINISLIPHVGPSTADNLLEEEFHLWLSPQGNPKEFY